jgi:hypothetical protein
MPPISRETLRDFLNEKLPDADMARVEKALRESADLRARLEEVKGQVDTGEHTVGAIWRRERVSCIDRDQLGSYLLGAADDDLLAYIKFHIEVVGCPECRANLDDLKRLDGGRR